MRRGKKATMFSIRWRWVTAMAVPCTSVSKSKTTSRRDSNGFDIEEMLKAKLATIFEDPVAEDEEITSCCSCYDPGDNSPNYKNNVNKAEDIERVKKSTMTTTALVARKGGGWKKVKELQSRFKKTRMQIGMKGSYVYFLAAFVAKGGFHSPPAAYLSHTNRR